MKKILLIGLLSLSMLNASEHGRASFAYALSSEEDTKMRDELLQAAALKKDNQQEEASKIYDKLMKKLKQSDPEWKQFYGDLTELILKEHEKGEIELPARKKRRTETGN
jgi:hypothetical protein